MTQLIKDIISFLQTLSFIDYILYFAVLVLIILVITLIYIMKMSEYESFADESEGLDDEVDLRKIVSTIDENPTPVVDMTAYEAEQEEKAIISYDELIKTASHHPINYDGEELVDNEIKVKKINLDQLTNQAIVEEVPKVEVKLFHYEREEAFLQTLKQLNELLN